MTDSSQIAYCSSKFPPVIEWNGRFQCGGGGKDGVGGGGVQM